MKSNNIPAIIGRLWGVISLAALIFGRVQAEPAQAIESAAKKLIGEQPGGVAIAYIDAQGVTFATVGNFGASDDRKISPDSLFEIGSVTKVFTSLLLAESERAGKVRRHDPVVKYLHPQCVDEATLEKITLVSLATHSSGLPRMPLNQPEANGPRPYETYSGERLRAALGLSGPSASVGKGTAYSNFGVSLLGEALGAAWQESYAEALTQQVLRPLGLEHTTLGMTGSPASSELVNGYSGNEPVEHWQFQAMAPAGALRSSARDMALFVQTCLGLRPTPLSPALAETLKPVRPMDAPPGQIGLAWMIMDNGGQPLIWHNGATGGFRAFVGFVPGRKCGVVVLASNNALNVDALGLQLLNAKTPAPVAAVVKDAKAYTGSYSFSLELTILVTERRGALALQMTAQPSLPLKEKSPGHFSVIGVPAEVSFERDASGEIVALTLHQNGTDRRAPRTQELTLAPEKIAEYVGTFALSPDITISMSVDNGVLHTQLTGQPKFPVFASASDDFFLKVVNARLRFERDAGGKIVAVTLIQNGRETRAPKTP